MYIYIYTYIHIHVYTYMYIIYVFYVCKDFVWMMQGPNRNTVVNTFE